MVKKKKSGAVGITLIGIVVLLICGLLIAKTNSLKTELEAKQTELAGINADIAAEQSNTEDIRNEIRYHQTDEYIEDQARDLLGLTYPDDIIIKPDTEKDGEN